MGESPSHKKSFVYPAETSSGVIGSILGGVLVWFTIGLLVPAMIAAVSDGGTSIPLGVSAPVKSPVGAFFGVVAALLAISVAVRQIGWRDTREHFKFARGLVDCAVLLELALVMTGASSIHFSIANGVDATSAAGYCLVVIAILYFANGCMQELALFSRQAMSRRIRAQQAYIDGLLRPEETHPAPWWVSAVGWVVSGLILAVVVLSAAMGHAGIGNWLVACAFCLEYIVVVYGFVLLLGRTSSPGRIYVWVCRGAVAVLALFTLLATVLNLAHTEKGVALGCIFVLAAVLIFHYVLAWKAFEERPRAIRLLGVYGLYVAVNEKTVAGAQDWLESLKVEQKGLDRDD